MENAADVQLYVRLISGMILGLTVGKLLSGTAKFIQHPKAYRINWLHGLWIVFIFCAVLVFWWQEALAFGKVQWTFPLYVFQIAYCASYLFMTAVLLPDEVDEYESHLDYFIARRHWFYGVLIVSFLLSIGDMLVKDGWDDTLLDPTYLVINLAIVALLVAAMLINRMRLHVTTAAIMVGLAVLALLLE